jgi:hypothetical protein
MAAVSLGFEDVRKDLVALWMTLSPMMQISETNHALI